jgi:hypothetical protein
VEREEGVFHYILQYRPDPFWYYGNQNIDWSKFTGIIKQLDVDRNQIGETEIKNGKNFSSNKNGRTQECCSVTVNWAYRSAFIDFSCPSGTSTFWAYTRMACGGGASGDSGSSPIGGAPSSGGGGPDNSGMGGGTGNQPSGGGGGNYGSTDQSNDYNNPIAIYPEYKKMSKSVLEALLLENPEFLMSIPCAELAKWKNIASFKPPVSVINKISSLKANYPSAAALFTGNFNLQSLQEASGKTVNMDYFPVTISQLPRINGQLVTAPQFLDHIRKNINQFIDNQYSEFSPYTSVNTGVDEANLWNSSNPVNSIIHIGIPNDNSLIGNDGSVICSDYTQNYWRFTTISAPWDKTHPVSGTREFGFITNADGTYTFYTRGVDRITESLDALILEGVMFNGADNLWTSFQNKVSSFVAQNRGNASKQDPIIARPNWSSVAEVLNGTKPLSSIGCY